MLIFGFRMWSTFSRAMGVGPKNFLCQNKPTSRFIEWPKGFFDLTSLSEIRCVRNVRRTRGHTVYTNFK